MQPYQNGTRAQEKVIPASHFITTTTKERNSKPEDPFHGYFSQLGEPPEPEPMIKSRSASRWFKTIHSMIHNGEYLLQQTMTGKSGPEVFSNSRDLFMLSSYDYLGLIGHPHIERSTIDAVKKYGTGTGGARMLAGTNQLHRQLEIKIASIKGKEAAITCTSGYMANLAAVTTLISKTDRVIGDELVHRSLIDATNMAQVQLEKFRHNDVSHLRELLAKPTIAKKTFVLIEGIYSMDGDICPLPEVIALKKEFDFYLLVDESHSFGVLGLTGRGVDEYFGVSPDEIDIFTSALSKAIPGGGGFIATSKQAVYFMQHNGSPFVFSGALSPANTAGCLAGLEILEKEGAERVERLFANTDYLKKNLKRLGYNTGVTKSPILPVILGDRERTLALSARLYQLGFLANPVFYPAIPPGADRLRLCVTAAQTKAILDEVIHAFDIAREVL
jgi:8-amino-7-oxononanoate synthase